MARVEHRRLLEYWLASAEDATVEPPDDGISLALVGRGAIEFVRYLVCVKRAVGESVVVMPWAITHGRNEVADGGLAKLVVFNGETDAPVDPDQWHAIAKTAHVLIAGRNVPAIWPCGVVLPFDLPGRRAAGVRHHVERLEAER